MPCSSSTVWPAGIWTRLAVPRELDSLHADTSSCGSPAIVGPAPARGASRARLTGRRAPSLRLLHARSMGRRHHAATAAGSAGPAHRPVGEAARAARRRGARGGPRFSPWLARWGSRSCSGCSPASTSSRPTSAASCCASARSCARPIRARTITCPGRSSSVLRPSVTAIRKEEIGFRTVEVGPPARYQDVDAEALMLTGDENIVKLEFIVQYKVRADATGDVRLPVQRARSRTARCAPRPRPRCAR